MVMNDDQISQSEIRRVKDILGRKTVYSNAQRMNNSERKIAGFAREKDDHRKVPRPSILIYNGSGDRVSITGRLLGFN